MNLVRALAVWLCAPLLASLACTIAWGLVGGGGIALKYYAVDVGAVSFAFALVGSTLLSGLFAAMKSRPVGQRYLVLLGFAAPAGGAMMLALRLSPYLIAVGAVYGLTTAGVWVGLHRALCGPRRFGAS